MQKTKRDVEELNLCFVDRKIFLLTSNTICLVLLEVTESSTQIALLHLHQICTLYRQGIKYLVAVHLDSHYVIWSTSPDFGF